MILGNAGLHCRALSSLRLQALLFWLFAFFFDATHGCSRVMECSTMWFWLRGFGIRCCRRDASEKRVLSIGGWFCRVEEGEISSASLHDTAHSLSIAGVEASKSQHTELLLLVFCDFNWEDVDGLDTTESDHNDRAPCCRSWVSFRLAGSPQQHLCTLQLIPYPPPLLLCLSPGHHQVWQSLRQAFSSNFSSRAARKSIKKAGACLRRLDERGPQSHAAPCDQKLQFLFHVRLASSLVDSGAPQKRV